MKANKRYFLYACTGIAAALGTSMLSADDGEKALLQRAQAIFKPLPADASTPERPLKPEVVELGRALFFETRVSTDGKGSCAGCHNPFLYGTDALPRSVGIGG
ncbi:MAG TPA: cytochrome c peroxidase, partial [Burkholderiales bacterium]|nr:cytochrome c peroxidase [Burkholderiales bacterium]